MTVLYKQPSEAKVYSIEFADQLATGDSLSAITSITESTGDITIAGETIVGTLVQATFSGGDNGTTYHIECIVTTSDGETIEVDVYLSVLDSPSDRAGEMTFFSLRTLLADDLGWTRHAGHWSSDEIDRLGAAINAGYRQFLYPEPLEGETVQHEWSFLRPAATFNTVSGTYTYDLPATFGAMVGDINYSSTDYGHKIIEQVTPGIIDRDRSIDNATGKPTVYALRPKSVAMTAEQTTELMLYPTPDAVYSLRYHYDAKVSTLNETYPYVLGGQAHFDTILQSCRDKAAAWYKDDPLGKEHIAFLKRLRASIESDRRLSPKTLGYNDDGRRITSYRHGADFTVSMRNNLG